MPRAHVLALGGFGGNLALSLLDHAQNGFYKWAEWIPVIAAAFTVSFLGTALARPAWPFLRVCLGVLAFDVVVGVVGLVLHVAADLRRPAQLIEERVIYGAPPFAPLLFADLALLAALGLWAMRRRAA